MGCPGIVVIGIDCADFAVVTRLMAEGRLPALAGLARDGSFGRLASTFPPHTAPGWTSMFTGVNPGRHGIYQFWHTQAPDYAPAVVRASDWRREALWSMLERQGLRVGVVNVPMTHPPQALDGGYMISWPLVPTLHYSEPKGLVGELARAGVHHQSDLVTMYRGQPDYLEHAHGLVERRTEAVLHLQRTRPVDALIVVFTELDRVSHHYWGDGERPAPAVEAIYQGVDRAVARILAPCGPDTLVVVASDHGCGRCAANLNVNRVLEQAGLLAVALAPDGDDDGTAADDVSGDGRASWFQSGRRYRRVIDWSGTRAFMPTPGCFGINLNLAGRDRHGVVAPDQREAVIAAIKDAFAALTHDGAPVFDVVPAAAVYAGEAVALAPDLLLLPRSWEVMPFPGLDLDVWCPPTQQAVHRPDGILFARGPGIPAGSGGDARIEDVTPLILAQLGLPVPEDLDGHWRIEPPVPVRREPARRTAPAAAAPLSDEARRLMEERMKGLGYL